MEKIIRPEPKLKRPDSAKLMFKGVIFEVYQWQQQMYDGSTETFEALKRPDTVSIIPVTKDKKFIILRQEQPGLVSRLGFPGECDRATQRLSMAQPAT